MKRTTTYEIVHDAVRTKADDPRQWLVYVNGVLRAEGTSKQSAEDFVSIEKARDLHRRALVSGRKRR